MYHYCHYPAGDNSGCVSSLSFQLLFCASHEWYSYTMWSNLALLSPNIMLGSNKTDGAQQAFQFRICGQTTFLLNSISKYKYRNLAELGKLTRVLLSCLQLVELSKAETYMIWHHHCLLYKQPGEQVYLCVTYYNWKWKLTLSSYKFHGLWKFLTNDF